MIAVLLAGAACLLAAPSLASAGTYPMYQCAPGTPAVSPGWSVYGYNTDADTVLSNTCSTGGSIGDYVFSDEQAGAVTENGSSGSQVGLALDVPSSAPDVSIQSINAEVIGSSVTGDDAWLGFASAGQSLPGGAELPYGGSSDYTASDSWTLPQGARDFEAYVNCSTDHSSPTCDFADSISVPALSDITLTLTDDTPPVIKSASGPLATAAADKSTVAGSQTLSFTASDADSGVRSATLTLTPQDGETPYTHTFNFAAQCSYDSWNACPLTESVSEFALNTATLKDDSYTVNLTVTDGAANTESDSLGTITTRNTTPAISPLGALPGPGSSAGAAGTQPSAIGLGAPNGTGASEAAQLRLGVPATILRSFAHRALRVTGRLLNDLGDPIGNATLAIVQQIAGSSRTQVIAYAKTQTNGTFAVRVPAGPSRLIEVAYRAFSADASYAAQAKIEESVRAGVELNINPRRTNPSGTITLTGKVQGPIPPQGTILDLLVHYRGRWEPFRTPRTSANGRFRVVYQFEGGVGRFPFRAEVPAGQAGFPFVGGYSVVVDVSTG
ncbi:MAG: hypothetical protein ACLQQB_10995, partial [Solirubrobacteraceae bacterium]